MHGLVAPLNEFFDLKLYGILFCFRLFVFADLVFIVHQRILLHKLKTKKENSVLSLMRG